MLLQFAEKNPGMTRVMVGDALVFENERLQQRMNQFFDKIESSLKQSLRAGADATLGHAHRGCAGARLDAHRLRRGPAAALRPLGLQARAVGAPGSQPGAHALTLACCGQAAAA